MAYKKLEGVVVAEYNGNSIYETVSNIYNLLIVSESYAFSEVCMNKLFEDRALTCPAIDTVIIAYDALTAVEKDLLLGLFGYTYNVTFTTCRDNGACMCDNRNYNGRNIISKREFGVLTNDNYLNVNYTKEYLIQLDYSEEDKCIYLTNEHSAVSPPAAGLGVLDLSIEFYQQKMLMTYVGFDIDNAKFIEQIVLDQGQTVSGVWKYDISDVDCFHYNVPSCVEDELEVYNDLVVTVDYINDAGFLSQTQVAYPVVNKSIVNVVDGKMKLDGVYKTYYFNIPFLTEMLADATYVSSRVLSEGSIYYFEYLNADGEAIKQYMKANEAVTVESTTASAVVVTNGLGNTTYDLTSNAGILAFAEDNFTVVTGIDFLKNLGTFRNIVNLDGSVVIDGYVGEDSHLVTYDLRDDIINSITNCEFPCERFSSDEWIGLMQKKMAASIAFCNKNLQEAARIMSTVDKKCKGC